LNLQQKPAKQRVCDTLTVAEVEQDAGHTTENLRLYRVIFGLYPYGIAVKSQEFVMPVRVQTKQALQQNLWVASGSGRLPSV
jgi:hypothetical protein